MEWIAIGVTALISALLLLVEHYCPWEKLLTHKIHKTLDYILGTLALVMPQTVLLAIWGDMRAILLVWCVTVAGGAAVLGGYALDGWINAHMRAKAAEQEGKLLRPGGENDAWTKEG